MNKKARLTMTILLIILTLLIAIIIIGTSTTKKTTVPRNTYVNNMSNLSSHEVFVVG